MKETEHKYFWTACPAGITQTVYLNSLLYSISDKTFAYFASVLHR